MKEIWTKKELSELCELHNDVYADGKLRIVFKDFDYATKQIFVYAAEDFDDDELKYFDNLVRDNLNKNITTAIIKNDVLLINNE